jgi:RNA polymerase primary sigma factor
MGSEVDIRERNLLRAAKSGDRDARERIVRDHGRVLRGTAARYGGLGLPVEDLVQEAAIGLLTAIDSYDESRGTSFESFARSQSRLAITDALTARGRLVRLPKQVVERQRAIARTSSMLAASSGHFPSAAEISDETGLAVDAVEAIRSLPSAPLSLDQPISEEGGSLVASVRDPSALDPQGEAMAMHRSEAIAEAVDRLSERQRYVIERRYGFRGPPASLVDLSRELRLSAQRTRSIEQAALFRLAKMLESDPAFPQPEWTTACAGTCAVPRRPRQLPCRTPRISPAARRSRPVGARRPVARRRRQPAR